MMDKIWTWSSLNNLKGCLISFGILNMTMAVWDRRLCDRWGDNEEVYKKCDVQMFRLLVVELVAINLGLLQVPQASRCLISG